MQPDETYHLFNHANGNENLFVEEKNYLFFLDKMTKYLLPVCSIYSYCLMPNHFHLVIGIRNEATLSEIFKTNLHQGDLSQKLLENKVSKTFGNFFSSYTQAFNKVYNRKGSLFIPSMKTVLINDENHFCKAVHYTNANPVHHGFTDSLEEWNYSSYPALISMGSTKLERQYVLDLFGGKERFIQYHEQPVDVKYKFPE